MSICVLNLRRSSRGVARPRDHPSNRVNAHRDRATSQFFVAVARKFNHEGTKHTKKNGRKKKNAHFINMLNAVDYSFTVALGEALGVLRAFVVQFLAMIGAKRGATGKRRRARNGPARSAFSA
jgi:hypothetical protein